MGKGEGRDTQEQKRRDAHDCTVGMGVGVPETTSVNVGKQGWL